MGHSRWETYKAKRLREMEADAQSHSEYEQAFHLRHSGHLAHRAAVHAHRGDE